MVTKAKRVGLWAAAIFAAGHMSGCAFAWLAAARADTAAGDVVDVPCDVTGPSPTDPTKTATFAVYDAPGRTWQDLKVSVYRIDDAQAPKTVAGFDAYSATPTPIQYAADGKAIAVCADGQTSVRLLVR